MGIDGLATLATYPNWTAFPGVTAYDTELYDSGVLGRVATEPGSIGFAHHSEALRTFAKEAVIYQDFNGNASSSEPPVSCTPKSLQLAAMTQGLDYGNDGDDPKRNTLRLSDTTGRTTWPMAMAVYIGVRKETLRPGAVCANMNATVDFFAWGSDDAAASRVIDSLGFARFSTEDQAYIVGQIRADMKCDINLDGALQQVYVPPVPLVNVQIVNSPSLHSLVDLIFATYVSDFTYSQIEFVPSLTGQEIADLLTGNDPDGRTGIVILADENTSEDLRQFNRKLNLNLVDIPYIGEGLVLGYRLCSDDADVDCPYEDYDVKMDVKTAAMILDGEITHWNDTRITNWNPEYTDWPPDPIIVISGPHDAQMHFVFVVRVRRCCKSDFAYDAPDQRLFDTFAEQFNACYGTPFCFGFFPMNFTIGSNSVSFISLIGAGGYGVQPSSVSIEKCSSDSYDSLTGTFILSTSTDPGCYPLVETVTLWTQASYVSPTGSCGATSVAEETAFLANFLISGKLAFSMRQRGLGFLTDLIISPITNSLQDMVNGSRVKNGSSVLISPSRTEEDGITINGQAAAISDLNAELTYCPNSDCRGLSLLDLASLNRVEMESIACNGESVIKVAQDLRLIPEPLIIFMDTLLGVLILFILGLVVWVLKHRNRKLVRNSSPAFMLQVLLGCAMQGCTVIALAQQDDYLVGRAMLPSELKPDPSLDAACITSHVLFSVGFFMAFSALFLKAWRLIRIFNNTKLRHLYVRDRQLILYQIAVLTFVVVLNLIWALTDHLIWVRMPTYFDSRTGYIVASSGLCYSRGGIASALPLIIGVVLMLFLGNYLAYLGRHIPTEFNESRWTAMAMVVNLEAFMLGVPVLVLANDQPVAGYAVKSMITLLSAYATVGLVFAPKLALAYGWFKGKDDTSDPWKFVNGSSSDNNGNKKSSRGASRQKGVEPSAASNNNKSTAGGKPGGKANNNNNNNNGPSLGSLLDIPTTSPVLRRGAKPDAPAAPSGGATTTRNQHLAVPASTSVLPSASPFESRSQQLSVVLEDDPMRRRFRRYLATLHMDENVRFWDAVGAFMREEDKSRPITARGIVMSFILDNAPKQVNLNSKTKEDITSAFNENDVSKLGRVDFFNEALKELFDDLKNSQAFMRFLDEGGSTAANLAVTGPSDISLS